MSSVGYWPSVQNARQDQDGGFLITSTSRTNCVALGTRKTQTERFNNEWRSHTYEIACKCLVLGYTKKMSSFRPCCKKIIGQLRISNRAKRHVVQRHFPPQPIAIGRVSVFCDELSPNYVFKTAEKKLRSGRLQGERSGNCLRYRITLNSILGTKMNGSPSNCMRVVCTTSKCSSKTCRRMLPREIITIYPI